MSNKRGLVGWVSFVATVAVLATSFVLLIPPQTADLGVVAPAVEAEAPVPTTAPLSVPTTAPLEVPSLPEATTGFGAAVAGGDGSGPVEEANFGLSRSGVDSVLAPLAGAHAVREVRTNPVAPPTVSEPVAGFEPSPVAPAVGQVAGVDPTAGFQALEAPSLDAQALAASAAAAAVPEFGLAPEPDERATEQAASLTRQDEPREPREFEEDLSEDSPPSGEPPALPVIVEQRDVVDERALADEAVRLNEASGEQLPAVEELPASAFEVVAGELEVREPALPEPSKQQLALETAPIPEPDRTRRPFVPLAQPGDVAIEDGPGIEASIEEMAGGEIGPSQPGVRGIVGTFDATFVLQPDGSLATQGLPVTVILPAPTGKLAPPAVAPELPEAQKDEPDSESDGTTDDGTVVPELTPAPDEVGVTPDTNTEATTEPELTPVPGDVGVAPDSDATAEAGLRPAPGEVGVAPESAAVAAEPVLTPVPGDVGVAPEGSAPRVGSPVESLDRFDPLVPVAQFQDEPVREDEAPAEREAGVEPTPVPSVQPDVRPDIAVRDGRPGFRGAPLLSVVFENSERVDLFVDGQTAASIAPAEIDDAGPVRGAGARSERVTDVGASMTVAATGDGAKWTYELPTAESLKPGLFESLRLPAGWKPVQEGPGIALYDANGAWVAVWSGGPVWDSGDSLSRVIPDEVDIGREPLVVAGDASYGPEAWMRLVSFENGIARAEVVVDLDWAFAPERVWPLFIDPGAGGGSSSTGGSTTIGLKDVGDGTVDGVDLSSGNWAFSRTDVELASVGPRLAMSRVYNSQNTEVGMFGLGWSTPFEMSVKGTSGYLDGGALELVDGDGATVVFLPSETGPAVGGVSSHIVNAPTLTSNQNVPWNTISTWTATGAVTSWIERNGPAFTLHYLDGSSQEFNSYGRLKSFDDPAGNRLQLTYFTGKVIEAEDVTSGRTINFSYINEVVRYVIVADPSTPNSSTATVLFSYTYDNTTAVHPNLLTACDPVAVCERYYWNSQTGADQKISQIKDDAWRLVQFTDYDSSDRAVTRRQHHGAGSDFDQTTINYGSGNAQNRVVTDGNGNNWGYLFDLAGRLIRKTPPSNPENMVVWNTQYGYTTFGLPSFVVDGEDNATFMEYDSYGRLIERRVGRTGVDPVVERTWYFYDDEDDNGDPLERASSNVARECGELSGGNPNDLDHCIVSDWNDKGQLVSRSQRLDTGITSYESWTYHSEFDKVLAYYDAAGNQTNYWYHTVGTLFAEGMPGLGGYTYINNRWGQRDKTRAWDVVVNGTSTHGSNPIIEDNTYDASGRLMSSTGPVVVNPVTGVSHQPLTTYTYRTWGHLQKTVVSDVFDPAQSRTTQFVTDRLGREKQSTTAAGTITREFDGNGNVIRVCDARSNCVRSDFNSANKLIRTVAENYNGTNTNAVLSEMTYDRAGRMLTSEDGNGVVTSYGYDNADRPTSITLMNVNYSPQSNLGGSRNIALQTISYGFSGDYRTVTVTRSGDVDTTNLVDPVTVTTLNFAGMDKTIVNQRSAGNLVTSFFYNPAGTIDHHTTRLGSGPTQRTNYVYDDNNLVSMTEVRSGTNTGPTTSYGYDGLGQLTSVTNPYTINTSYTTNYTFDLAGRVTRTDRPGVQLNRSGPLVVPVELAGYDAFGNPTHTRDAHNRLVTSVFDSLDRVVQITHPAYDPPGPDPAVVPQEDFTYDPNGNLKTRTNRRGDITTFTYDDLNRPLTESIDVTSWNETAQTYSATTQTRSSEYDVVGNVTRTTSTGGAVVDYVFNEFNQVKEQRQIVRPITLDTGGTVPGGTYVTVYSYDNRGLLVTEKDPANVTMVRAYDELDQMTSSGHIGETPTTYTYQQPGLVYDTIDPKGRVTRTIHDPLGRVTHHQKLQSTSVIRETRYTYWENSQIQYIYEGNTGTQLFFYDQLGRIGEARTLLQDGSSGFAQSLYGYDFNGVLTYQRDPNGNITQHFVNTMGLTQTTREASTTAHNTNIQRDFTTAYDADGNITWQFSPDTTNARWTAHIRDELGRPMRELAWGDRLRYFTYDDDGRNRYAYSPVGIYSYNYDDRGLIAESTLGDTHTTYTYDSAGRMLTRAEQANGQTLTHNYTWTAQNELFTHTDPVAGATGTYTWNPASDLQRIDYTSGAKRTFIYNAIGDLYEDKYVLANGNTRARSTYTYDDRGNIDEENRYLYGLGTRRHLYQYTRGNRLEQWQVLNGQTAINTATYTYDNAGNRLTRNTNGSVDTWTYDQRNRVLTGPGTTYTWKPGGQLDYSVVNGVTHDTFYDGFGHMSGTKVGNDPWHFYIYDAYDRISFRHIDTATPEQQFWLYSGHNQDPYLTIGGAGAITYGRSPSGQLTSTNDQRNGTPKPRIAGANQHGDLTYLTPANGTNTTKTISYGPYGTRYGQWGPDPTPEYGYQSDYTNPTTGDINMQARWYSPTTATFTSRDTYPGNLQTPISLNRYTYAGNNPIRYWDPLGRNNCRTTSDICDGNVVDSQGNFIPPGTKAGSFNSNVTVGGKHEGNGNDHCFGKTDCRPMTAVDTSTSASTAIDLFVTGNGNSTTDLTGLGQRVAPSTTETTAAAAYVQPGLARPGPAGIYFECNWWIVGCLGNIPIGILDSTVGTTAHGIVCLVGDDCSGISARGQAITDLASCAFDGSISGQEQSASCNRAVTSIAESCSGPNAITCIGDAILARRFGSPGSNVQRIPEQRATGLRSPVVLGRFADNVFYDIIPTRGGDLEILAEVSISGRTLTLSDIAVYGANGDLVNQVHGSALVGIRNALAIEAANAGFDTLRITGVRVRSSSSVNPGHVIDRVIDLERFRG